MFRNETPNNIRIVQLVFFFLGILTIAVGFYATGPQLEQFALHFSTDKSLDDSTISILHRLRITIIFLGIILVLLSMLVGYLVLLQDTIVRKIESEHLIERAVSFIEGLLGLIYRIGTNARFLWCLLISILIGSLIAGIFLSSSGGLHVEGLNLQPPKKPCKT